MAARPAHRCAVAVAVAVGSGGGDFAGALALDSGVARH